MGLSDGTWKLSRSPCNYACSPLDVELGSKRKFVGVYRDAGVVQTQGKKQRLVDDNICTEVAEVARLELELLGAWEPPDS